MINTIKITLMALILWLPLAAYAEKIDRTIDVSANGRINIEIMDGKITVEGWDKPQVRIVGEAPTDDHNFKFEARGTTTIIEHAGEHGFWNQRHGGGSYASLTIYAPRNSSFRLDSTSADYVLKNIKGQVRADTMSGNISLEGGVDSIDLESVSGNLRVTGASGRLNLSTVSGTIETDGDADQFEAQTVSGDIRAHIGSSERLNLESVSGNINLKVELSEKARLDADTVSGNIEIELGTAPINASFEIETGPGGDVTNLLSDHKAKDNSSFSGSMQFKLGDGDSSVNLETMSGTIRLDR